MNQLTKEIIDIKNVSSIELLEYISWKKDFPEAAADAFSIFCSRYQKDILQKTEIHCKQNGYSTDIAEMIAHCTFARVWKYPTFNMEKAKSKDVDKAILIWMYRIMHTQAILFFNENSCSEPSEEEDLSIIENVEELIDYTIPNQPEKKRELILKLEAVEELLNGLSEKHRIIYLTYKAYERNKKNIPRSVSKKLQERLDLTQNSIRVYKMEANKHVENFIKRVNGN